MIANQGLEDEVLCDEICRRTERTATEAMIVAPVVAHSRLAELSDDVDREMEVAERRVESVLQLVDVNRGRSRAIPARSATTSGR